MPRRKFRTQQATAFSRGRARTTLLQIHLLATVLSLVWIQSVHGQAPNVVLSPSSLTFTFQQGAPPPPSQSLNISIIGGGVLTWMASTSPQNVFDYSISPNSGTGNAVVTVSISLTRSNVTGGTYTGDFILVTVNGATNSPLKLTVTVISLRPQLAGPIPSFPRLSFDASLGGQNPSNQTVTVSNVGTGIMTWTAVVTSGSWLSVSPASGINTGTLTVSVNISGLSTGNYTGTIQIAAPFADYSPQNITVTLALVQISFSPTSLNFTAFEGGANPADQFVNITPNGRALWNWTATISSITGGNWLSVTPSGRTGILIGSLGDSTRVKVNIAGLVPHSYSATIQIGATPIFEDGLAGPKQTVTIPITLTFSSGPPPPQFPQIALSSNSLLFSAQPGGANPANQTVLISNTGIGTLGWTATIVSGFWVGISPLSGNGDSSLTVSANITGLFAGTYSGTIRIAATSASNSPQVITVTLAVGAPVLAPNGILSNASFNHASASIAPGSIVAIFGQNLTDGTSCAYPSCGPTLDASGVVKTTMTGTQVLVNGTPSSLFNTTPGQLVVVLPSNISGPTATLQVSVGGQTSSPIAFPVSPLAPGIFTLNNQGTGQGAIQINGTSLIAAPLSGGSRLAHPGEFVVVYCTGLGAVTNPPGDGKIAGGNSATTTPVLATVGGIAASVTFSGLSPGFVGLYQVNVQVPAGSPAGDAIPLALSIGGVPSNTVTMAVQ